MGKRLAKPNSQPNQVPGDKGQGQGQAAEGRPITAAAGNNSSTEAPGIGDIRIIGDNNGGKAQASVPGLPTVKDDIPKPSPKKPARKKKAAAATKSGDTQLTAEMLASLFGVVFGLLSTRMGTHWQLSPQEAQALAEPTSNILARYDLTKKTGAYADFMALGIAVMGIIVPKVMIELAKPKKPKKGALRHVDTLEQTGGSRRTTPDTEARKINNPDPDPKGTITLAPDGPGHGLKSELVGLIQPT